MGKTAKVVMFCGGNGAGTIARALVDQGVDLTLVVNCYDDGLSTGAIRIAIPGMLGPSDIRKNVARFAFDADLGVMLERRDVHRATGTDGNLLRWFDAGVDALSTKIDLTDCPVGNLIFAGCYLTDGGTDFNRTAALFQEECMCECRVLNVTHGECLRLEGSVQEEFGQLLWLTEAEISTRGIQHPISMLSLGESEPGLNLLVKYAIDEADLIVYGPGTQHSSLLPSYLTYGLAEVLIECKAPKVYIANLTRDKDIAPNETFENLTKKFVVCMSRYGRVAVTWDQLVTHTMIDKSSWASEGWVASLGKTYLGRFANGGNVHHGVSVAQCILSLVSTTSGHPKTRPSASKRQQTAS